MHKTPTLAGAALIITLFGLTPAWAAKEPVVLAMPYTIGAWGSTEPVQVSLVKGRNEIGSDKGIEIKV